LFELDELLDQIKNVNSVMAAYIFEPDSLPSAELMIF
jgi:predicted regulator of Ras-like GTPase activity (Roadblock/LC7/MglB family)